MVRSTSSEDAAWQWAMMVPVAGFSIGILGIRGQFTAAIEYCAKGMSLTELPGR